MEHEVADELARFLLDVLTLARSPQIPERYAAVESLQSLYNTLFSLKDFLYTASTGDFSRDIAFKGYVAGALKTLQANLRHIAWQTKMVAGGDFNQHIEFMGEFSQSFNAMVTRLRQNWQELAKKEEELKKLNEELRQEITIRKRVEANLRESEEAFRLMSITDSLTGLYNRRHFNRLAEDEIYRALRFGRPLAAMMLDIDFFKRVNDTFGHPAGDTVLKQIARATQEVIRTTDIPARYGGEEFVILLPETTGEVAAAIAERLRRLIEETTIQTEKGPITITASLGVSNYPADVAGTESMSNEKMLAEFIAATDKALYASKKAGRNRVTIYRPDR